MAAKALTLSQLQLAIKGALSEKFPLATWVSAEIAELKVNYSGHCYLELVEKGENDKLAKAQSRAVIWRSNYTLIASTFRAQTGQELGAGLKVLVKVLINFHELYGLSLQITDIDPAYTLGDAERQRQLTIAQLKKDGVWDMNHELPMPRLLQRIAIVSSANAAGYQDFYNEIYRSDYHIELTLFEAFMQGAGAEDSIISALESIATSTEEFDAVVIIRGGGSANDLQCFNGYRIASHVAQFPLPIIAGIGHDKDVSIVDMVAAQTLKTPTAVATMLVERMSQIEAWLEAVAIALHDSAVVITRQHVVALENYSTELKALAQQIIGNKKSYIDNIATNLIPERCDQFLRLHRAKIEGLQATIELQSPVKQMNLGYAIARRGGKAISSGEGVSIGEEITVEIADAHLTAQITKIEQSKR